MITAVESSSKRERTSGIELIKVFAVLLIVTSHVVQTLYFGNEYILYSDYAVNLTHATTDFQTFVLIMLQYSGSLGNSIFFLCSAWFLLESKKADSIKLMTIMFQMWSVSSISLAVALLIKGNIPFKLIIKSLLPFNYATNWYVGCYVLFYAIHPMLNTCIASLKQVDLLRAATVMGVLYCGFNYIHTSFYCSSLILWIAIYFIVAYLKKYMISVCNDLKKNVVFLILGSMGNIFMIFVTNILGQKIAIFSEEMLRWNSNSSPFLLLIAFSLFNIGRHLHFKSKFINYISSLSLLIYIIHENLLVKTYIRPFLWQFIYENFGYDRIVCWAMLMIIVIFVVSVILSILYKCTIQKVITYLIPKVRDAARKIYKKYESIVMRY